MRFKWVIFCVCFCLCLSHYSQTVVGENSYEKIMGFLFEIGKTWKRRLWEYSRYRGEREIEREAFNFLPFGSEEESWLLWCNEEEPFFSVLTVKYNVILPFSFRILLWFLQPYIGYYCLLYLDFLHLFCPILCYIILIRSDFLFYSIEFYRLIVVEDII